MNVLDLLDKELKEKGTNWSIEEKARYLYIRSCELFTYDPRYKLYHMLRKEEKIQELREKEIDLEHVDDFRVICSSYSLSVLSCLLQELLNIDSELRGRGHAWITCKIGEVPYTLDASLNDLSRVKMKLLTKGFHLVQEPFLFKNHLKQIDQEVGYITEDYRNEEIKRKGYELKLKKEFSQEEILKMKLQVMKEAIQKFSTRHFYNDCYYLIGYLSIKFLTDQEFSNRREIRLLEEGNPEKEIANLQIFDINGQKIPYILEKEEGLYTFREIREEEIEEKKKKYKFFYRY